MEKITKSSDKVLIDPNEPLILPDGTALVGRVEWFLYALCCLDYQNLPTPMSRIEEFANALITGEIPNIQPQSRAEQFFLAILDGNISDLPQPQSRSEVLLDKLARGEFDLSDVEPIQSRYELLLAYLIKNGGIGNIDYVLYEFSEAMKTMYNTVEKPFKSLELSGNTLVNCVLEDTENDDYTSFDEDYSGTSFTINGTSEGAIKSAILSGSTKYQIGEFIQDVYAPVQQFKTGYYLNHSDGTLIKGENNHRYCEDYIPLPIGVTSITSKGSSHWKKLCCYDSNKNFISGVNGTVELEDLTLNIPSNAKYFRYSTNTAQGENEYINVVSNTGLLLASSNYNIPCELLSVKLPVLTTTNCLNLFTKDNTVDDGGQDVFGDFVEAKKNDKFSFNEKYGYDTWTSLAIYNVNKEMIYYKYEDSSSIPKTIVLPDDDRIAYVRPRVANIKIDTIMFNRGEVIPYEEYKANKTNILSTPEDLELRGIDDVKDELDCLSGEVTERIGRFIEPKECSVEHSSFKPTDSNIIAFAFNGSSSSLKFKSSKLIQSSNVNKPYSWWNTIGVWYVFRFPKADVATISDFKQWLLDNEVLHTLRVPVIKTVDLNVVDQNNNKIDKIHVFDEVTHVNASSDELTPTVNIGKSVSYPTIIKPNTKYTVDLKRNDKPLTVNLGGTEVTFTSGETRKIITTPSTLTNDKLSYYGIGAKCNEIMLIEGEIERNIDYFTGMQSAVMQNQMPVLTTTGKNLFDMKNSNFITEKDGNYYSSSDSNLFDTYTLLPNTTYTISGIFSGWGKCFINGVNLGNFNSSGRRVTKKFTTDSTGVTTIYFGANTPNDASRPCYDFQLEIGDVFTSYEPYKSNILSTPSDLELKSAFMCDNSTIRDEINLLRGELKESTLSITLNGSENWALGGYSANIDGYPHFTLNASIDFKQNSGVICKFPFKDYDLGGWKTYEGCAITTGSGYKKIMIRVNSDIATSVDEFKEWLKKNPFEMVLVKNTSTIKTVDLNVVDQDGNTIPKIKSYKDVTHLEVTVPKQSLLPNVSAEVATDNSKDMSSLTTKHQEISETQSAIQDNIQSQSDEIDTALMATTEIFESILE